MYLSSVVLHQASRHTMRALVEPQLMHGAVESAFPGERSRRLWRVDHYHGECRLLLASSTKPDLTSIAVQFGYPDKPDTMRTLDYAAFLQQLQEGQLWRFRLKANPVVSVADASAPRGQVMAHVTPAQQRTWLSTRAGKHGFSLEDGAFDVVHTAWLRFSKGNGHKVSLKTATFEGVMKVENPEELRTALTRGIGRGKAYGCGLLTLAPL